ncbi:MAG: TadA family conjugal transfer-associated ATPase [Actinomycetota bacterium]|nr:TadA family conjugal transfer-associated ATPase [Actinomycetota bacterium]
MNVETIVDRVRTRLAGLDEPAGRTRVAELVRLEAGALIDDADLLSLIRSAEDELVGAGPLESLLRRPGVTDVLVNGPDDVWVDTPAGLQRTEVRFPDAAAVRRLAQRLAAMAGRRLDDATPWVDAMLPDGTRLHAVLPPVALDCTCICLRVLGRRRFSFGELVGGGTIPSEAAEILETQIADRRSFLVTGGTGSGKTTLLGALLSLVPARERLVLVEDAPELAPNHPHVVRLLARSANVEGAGAITLRDLVRQALRMRPDRVVVGEVRGAEVADLLCALNTGHQGGCGTVHANSPVEVPARLEALAAMGGLDRAGVHSQMSAGLDALVHVTRTSQGRTVSQIAEIVLGGQEIRVRPVWSW